MSTSTLLFVIVAALMLFVLMSVLRRRSDPNPADFPYQKAEPLFSPAERSFLGVIDQAVGADHRILDKVRIADVIEVRRNPNRSVWQRVPNRDSAKHINLERCEMGSLSVACFVEIDDCSHFQGGCEARYKFVVDACRAAALQLLQVSASSAYEAEEIGGAVRQLLVQTGITLEPENAH